MKKFLMGTVGLVALSLSAPASAADMRARPYTKAPPPMVAAIYDWSGMYIGINGGYGWSSKCWDFTTPGGAFVAAEGCHDADGGTVGGQIGYRWQASQWVFGLEAQGNWADFRGSNVSLLPGNVYRNESRVDAFGLFTGQIGYAMNNALLYVKGGAAVTSDRYRSFVNGTGIQASNTIDDTRWGAVVGVGLEYGFAPNWSFAVEYDHLFMDDRTYTFTNNGVAGAPGTLFGTNRISQDVDLITARINYRWGGPVVARY
ncbi:outer membrane beta-barrel protein [Bradyrhizobium sp.]|uniref:outer membrane protein n=1 Tax=Bradyrhizobium sp. TaxID=376 RepID=UPI000A54AB10|nr:outer membrane beta-barrel protein [Bradyrhizobium sp.]